MYVPGDLLRVNIAWDFFPLWRTHSELVNNNYQDPRYYRLDKDVPIMVIATIEREDDEPAYFVMVSWQGSPKFGWTYHGDIRDAGIIYFEKL